MEEALNAFINLVPVTLVQSLVYAFVAFGLMLPFRVLSFPDLTAEGSFPFGAAVCATLLTVGLHPVLATLAACAAGFIAGCVTALCHLRLKIPTLLAGILVLTILFSVNLRVMGTSNIPLLNVDTILTLIHSALAASLTGQMALFGVLMALMIGGFWWFMRTEHGMSMRAVGSNLRMAEAQGISVWKYTILGLGLANASIALGGALFAQQQGFADVNMGFGILIDGLAAVIIGEQIMGRGGIWRLLVAPVVGAVIYYQIISIGLAVGVQPSDLKMITGLFVILALGYPALRGKGSVEILKLRE